MNGHVLQKVDCENGLGVIISSDLKYSPCVLRPKTCQGKQCSGFETSDIYLI